MDRELSHICKGKYHAWGEGARSLFELATETFYKARWREAFSDCSEILHPQLVDKCMRDLSLERGGDLPNKPILFCRGFGGFHFTESFFAFFSRGKRRSNEPGKDAAPDWVSHFEEPWKSENRHAYDSVVAFGNLVMHKAPEMVAEYLKVKSGLDRQEWDHKQPKRPRSDRDVWSTYNYETSASRQFEEANSQYRQEFQSKLTAVVQQDPDLRQWYCARPAPTEIEEAGLLLASDTCGALDVAWVAPMASYYIHIDDDGYESVEW